MQTSEVIQIVNAIASRAARWDRHDADLFIVSDRLNVYAAALGQNSDRKLISLRHRSLTLL
jgi:hypothetical protein